MLFRSERNIRLYQEKADIILSCLKDGMTPSQWLMAFSIRADFHSGSDYKLCVIHRNFSNFVSYLEDCGRITVIRDSSEKRYYHIGC